MENNNLELKEYTIENFINAVHLLYYGESTDLKKKGDQFLCEFERKNEAWDIAMKILNTPNLEEEAYYNASQIIKKKIRFDFGNYRDVEIFKNLSNFLTEKIIEFKNHKLYLLSNFCKCYALLSIFAHESFPEIIQNICARLYNKDLKDLMALLLIFNYLAENENDSDIVIDESYRDSYVKFLRTISDDVVTFIDYLIKIVSDSSYKQEVIKNDPEMFSFFRIMNRNIVEAFKNWIEIGLSSQTYAKLSSEFIGIIEFIFMIDNENMEVYSECISLLLRLPLQNPQLSGLGLIILNKVISFKTRVFQAIEFRDDEEIKFFIDIFVNLCESNMEEIIKENRTDLLQIIVELTKNCPSDRIGFVCDFWQRFNYFLSDRQVTIQEITEKYGTLFKQIMISMLKLTKYEDDVFLELNQTKARKIKDIHSYKETSSYRKIIKLFFQDTSAFYSFFYVYNNILLPAITQTVENIKKNMNNITAWSEMEAEIFCFESICRNIDKNQDLSFLDPLFDTIFEIPENLIQIKRTVTDVIDEIGSILSLKPNILMKAFNYLLLGTDNPLLIKYCSISLKNLLSDNKKILCNNKADLIKIYDEKIKLKALENQTYQKILEGIVEVLCIGDDEREITTSLVQVLSSWVAMLSQAKEKFVDSQDISSEDLNSLCKIIEIVKIIIRSAYETLNIKHVSILSQIFIEVWPILRFLLQKFNSNSIIVEQLTQIIKHFMRGMSSEFKQYLEDYLNLILEGYKINPISSYLYAFEVVATVFVNDSSTESILKIMLKELCLQTFNCYLKSVEEFENNPHLTEDFFGLIYRIIRLNPCIILDFELFETLVFVCISNIGISHIDSAKNIIYFLEKVITFHELQKMKNMDEKFLGSYYEKVSSVIKKVGESLVTKIVSYILTVPPGMIFENLKDLIMDLISNYPQDCAVWFEKNLKELPGDCLTNTEKEKFIKTIINFNEIAMENILDNFYRRCLSRLYRQT